MGGLSPERSFAAPYRVRARLPMTPAPRRHFMAGDPAVRWRPHRWLNARAMAKPFALGLGCGDARHQRRPRAMGQRLGLPWGPSRARLLKHAARFLAQLHLLHLPRTRHGQFFDEDDMARDLVACDLAAAVLDDLGCGELVSWRHAHERDGHFAEARVGKTHHRDGSDGGMA